MEQKNNAGVAFKNDYKQKENHPDFKGNAMINGKQMDVAVWVKNDKNGKQYFSLSFSEPYVKQETPQYQAPSNDVHVLTDDDLPF